MHSINASCHRLPSFQAQQVLVGMALACAFANAGGHVMASSRSSNMWMRSFQILSSHVQKIQQEAMHEAHALPAVQQAAIVTSRRKAAAVQETARLTRTSITGNLKVSPSKSAVIRRSCVYAKLSGPVCTTAKDTRGDSLYLKDAVHCQRYHNSRWKQNSEHRLSRAPADFLQVSHHRPGLA